MKAEKAAEPVPAPAAEAKGQPQASGKSSAAPGKTKTGKAASPSKGKSAQAKTEARAQARIQQDGEQGRSGEAHQHVIVCHRTGSDSNPFVVINIPMTAWAEAHSPETGSHPTLNGRDDILLKDPASRPGSKDGFTKEDCARPAAVQQAQPEPEQQPQPQAPPQPERPAPQAAAGSRTRPVRSPAPRPCSRGRRRLRPISPRAPPSSRSGP